MQAVSVLTCLALVAVHLFSPKLKRLEKIPRSRVLSLAGGASVAYVFMHLLPELSARESKVAGIIASYSLSEYIYFFAMCGLIVFFGLERLASVSRKKKGKDRKQNGEQIESHVFWIHLVMFAFYNIIVGYLLPRREGEKGTDLVFYGVAMALHFLVADYGLRSGHKKLFNKAGRWILSGAVVAGFVLGALTEIHARLVSIFFAVLTGAVILNVLKEELPEERESSFWSFALGAAAYTVLLIAAH